MVAAAENVASKAGMVVAEVKYLEWTLPIVLWGFAVDRQKVENWTYCAGVGAGGVQKTKYRGVGGVSIRNLEGKW